MVNLVEIIVERPITFCSRNRKRNVIRNFRYRKRRRRIITVEKTVKFTASAAYRINETVRNIRYGIVMNRIRLCRRRAADVKAAASVDRQRAPETPEEIEAFSRAPFVTLTVPPFSFRMPLTSGDFEEPVDTVTFRLN